MNDHSLKELGEAIAQWRQSKSSRIMPEAIKRAVVGLLKQYRKAEILRGLQITHSLLDRWKKQYAEPMATSCGTLVALPPSTVEPQPDVGLALTIRRPSADLESQVKLTLAQWQQIRRLVP